MKNSNKIFGYIFALICFSFLLISCGTPIKPPKEEMKTSFIENNNIGAYYSVKTESTASVVYEMHYTKKDYQFIVSTDEKEYIVQRDDQKSLFSLEFSTTPILNQEIDVTLSTKGLLKFVPGTYKCTLVKESDGKKWFWIESQGYGFIVGDI